MCLINIKQVILREYFTGKTSFCMKTKKEPKQKRKKKKIRSISYSVLKSSFNVG